MTTLRHAAGCAVGDPTCGGDADTPGGGPKFNFCVTNDKCPGF
jgi:hypothetical protein